MRKYITQTMLWLFSLFLTVVFVNAGWPKFSATSGWGRAFAHWGFPNWFRVLVGVIEVAGGLLLLIPSTAIYAAIALAAIMLGAMGTHIIADNNPAAIYHEALPLALLGVIVYLRTRRSA
jgi:putative oxidoreductase